MVKSILIENIVFAFNIRLFPSEEIKLFNKTSQVFQGNLQVYLLWHLFHSQILFFIYIYRDQLGVLRQGLELVAHGGMVLYCTTALHPVENEAVVMGMLKECSG